MAEPERKQHVTIRVEGRVQGVYYRASTLDQAQQLGLVGFVRNESDGSVYIEAEGSLAELDALIRWCRVGPAGARVSQVNVIPGVSQNYTRFEIKR